MENKSGKPFFSIIIPTYNHAQYINRCLDSVITQTYSNWEVIVVNNYSEDNTIELVNNYLDERIRLVNFRNNGSIAASRNTGIKEATGEWICFLDSDDFWYHSKLEIVDKAIKDNQNIDAVCHNETMRFEVSGKTQTLYYGPFTPKFYRDLLYGNRCSTSAMSVRKAFLDEHELSFNTSLDYVIVEDYDLWLRMAFYNAVFHFIDIPLGEYIINEMNISGNMERQRKNQLKLLHDHTFFIQRFTPDKKQLWCKIKAQVMISSSVADIKLHKWAAGLSKFSQAVIASPLTTLKYIFSRLL